MLLTRRSYQQECIPIGCVPPALYCTGGLCPGGLCPEGLCPGGVSFRGVVSVSDDSPLDRDPREQNDRQTNVKHYLPATSLAGGKTVLFIKHNTLKILLSATLHYIYVMLDDK